MAFTNKELNTILNYKNKIISFDIFDTLITRVFVHPRGIFLLMQDILEKDLRFSNLPSVLKNNFAIIRENIEQYVQSNQFILNKKLESSFDEIYSYLKINYSLNNDEIEALKHLEIICEKNNLVPIQDNINLLKQLKKNNKIILTSDMYFSAQILRNFLSEIDPIFDNIEIFSSADINKRKSNGSSFKYLKKYLHESFIHIGDNKFSDYIQAKWNKIKPHWYRQNELLKYEQYLLKNNQDNLYINLSVGISKYLRLSSKNKVFCFGASFAGPIIYAYVDWILEDAMKNNIKTLYFVARDGYIPKLIADIIIEQHKLPIQTRYFYSSRKATRICDEDNYELFIRWIFSELPQKLTPIFIAERLNISVDEIAKYIDNKAQNKRLNQSQMNNLIEILLNNNELKYIILRNNQTKKNNFMAYIKQEINLSHNFAFVDINGSGRTQDNLCLLIKNEIKHPIISYYFHLQTDMKQDNISIKKAYFHNTRYISILLELLCRTLHGQTLGYENVGSQMVPILEYEKNSFVEKWGYDEYLNGILQYSKNFVKYTSINGIHMNQIAMYQYYANFYKKYIDKETAEIIGKIPFADYGNELKVSECAPSYNLFNVFNIRTINRYLSLIRVPFMPSIVAKFIINLFTKTNYGYISKSRNIAYLKLFNYKINIGNLIWK